MYNSTISNILICTEVSAINTGTILSSHINRQNEFEPEVNVTDVYTFNF